MVNIVGINFESIVDGDGVRITVFFSGCKHNCEGCHNPSSHRFDVGKEFTEELQEEIICYAKSTPFISGITLSGGDPMFSAAQITPFVQKVRTEAPDLNIWVYSGFTYEEIIADKERAKLLSLCDVLVDGRFVIDQRDPTLSYKGSRNQRIIDISKTKSSGSIVFWHE